MAPRSQGQLQTAWQSSVPSLTSIAMTTAYPLGFKQRRSCSCPASVSPGHLEPTGHGGDMVTFHDFGKLIGGVDHGLGMELPCFNDAVNRGHGEGGRRRHDRAKVAGGFSESQ